MVAREGGNPRLAAHRRITSPRRMAFSDYRTEPRYDKLDDSPGSTHNLVLGLVQPGSRVLEFGCATGYMSQALRDRLGGGGGGGGGGAGGAPPAAGGPRPARR